MADPTVADFTAEYPELSAVANIQYFLDKNTAKLSRKNWGGCFNEAVLLKSAHNIALSQNRQSESTVQGGLSITPGGRGALTSASVGGLSSSYTDHQMSNLNYHDDRLAQTPYGRDYLALRAECLPQGGLVPPGFGYNGYWYGGYN